VTVSIHNLVKEQAIPDQLQVKLIQAAALILQEYNLERGEVGIILTNNETLHQLNKQYRGLDAPTDVLSFGMIESNLLAVASASQEEELVVGDVYISMEKVEQQAREAGHPPHREILILAVHGLLHLIGYDHADEDGYTAMQKRETELLSQLE
jgi:probable rRNA maturation factor